MFVAELRIVPRLVEPLPQPDFLGDFGSHHEISACSSTPESKPGVETASKERRAYLSSSGIAAI